MKNVLYKVEAQSTGHAWFWRILGTDVSGYSKRINSIEDDAQAALGDYVSRHLRAVSSENRSSMHLIEGFELPMHKVERDDSKAQAVICDLDGTLAKRRDRGPYEFSRMGEDALNERVAWFLDEAMNSKTIVLLSGRDEEWREVTQEWLKNFGVEYDYLFMRPRGNRDSDDVVKLTLLEEGVLPTMYPWIVLDDRDRCVALWRKLDLECWQVDYGKF